MRSYRNSLAGRPRKAGGGMNTEYPTEEMLETIRKFKATESKQCLEYICQIWHYPEWAKQTRPGLCVFSTGGWSGNEEILDALYESGAWLSMFSNSIYLNGGFLAVATSDKTKKELTKQISNIVDWAWNDPIKPEVKK